LNRISWIFIIVFINISFVALTNAIYDYEDFYVPINETEYDGYIPEHPSHNESWWNNIIDWFNNTWVGEFFSLLNPITFFNALSEIPSTIRAIITGLYLTIMLYSLITIIRGN